MIAFSNTDWSLLQVSQWLGKFLFHDIIYLLVFVGVFHHNFTDFVATVLPTLSEMVVPSLLYSLSSAAMPDQWLFQNLWMFMTTSFHLLPALSSISFASTLARMAQRKSCLDFFFFFNERLHVIHCWHFK